MIYTLRAGGALVVLASTDLTYMATSRTIKLMCRP